MQLAVGIPLNWGILITIMLPLEEQERMHLQPKLIQLQIQEALRIRVTSYLMVTSVTPRLPFQK